MAEEKQVDASEHARLERKAKRRKPPNAPLLPYAHDEERKKALNPQADKRNFIAKSKKSETEYLACGANAKNGQGACRMPAGGGTLHKGYGRCKYHGGCSTGATTPEGKAKSTEAARQANLKHGLYSKVLGKDERAIFDQLCSDDQKATDLTLEINLLKTKILGYLDKQRVKWDKIAETDGPDVADRKTAVWFTASDSGNLTACYTPGAIDDRAFDRALTTLARLVNTQIKLAGDDVGDILKDINAELRAAGRGKAQESWGGPAQGTAPVTQDRPPTREEGEVVD